MESIVRSWLKPYAIGDGMFFCYPKQIIKEKNVFNDKYSNSLFHKLRLKELCWVMCNDEIK